MHYPNVNPEIMIRLTLMNNSLIAVHWVDINRQEYDKGSYKLSMREGRYPDIFDIKAVDEKDENHVINMSDVLVLHTSTYFVDLCVRKRKEKKTTKN